MPAPHTAIITCPHCGSPFLWEPADTGTRMSCGACQGLFVMPDQPGPGELLPPRPVPRPRLASARRTGPRPVDPLGVIALVSGLLAAGLVVVPCVLFAALPFALVGLVTGLFSLARRANGPAVAGVLLSLVSGGVSGYWTARFYGAVGRAVDQVNESTREHNERVRKLNER